MKRVDRPGLYLMWGDKLAEVVGISEGKVIHIQTLEPCPHCHTPVEKEYSFIEDSPYFQEMAAPVPTLATPTSSPDKEQKETA